MKVLVARTDKIGDVVLSLPVLGYLKERHPDWSVQVLVAPVALPLVENDPAVTAIWTYRDEDREILARKLAVERFDAAILLYYHKPLAVLLRKIKVPRRVGPLSKWSSWLLLNRGVWQQRSRGRRHESEYNLQLAQKLAGTDGAVPEPKIHLTAGQQQIAREFRARFAPAGQTVLFVHPGSGGSALNWSPARYAAVANGLAANPRNRVLVTGGPEDAETITAMSGELESGVEVIAGQNTLREFLGVLAGGDCFLGPSTGPLHMAGALGLAVVGLYSPLPTQSEARWGPRAETHRVISPAVCCPGRLVCCGERCRHWNCMDLVTVEAVVTATNELLQERTDGAVDRSQPTLLK
ncbi:MAG: glycosyltransferase family 9 protein [bacterium]